MLDLLIMCLQFIKTGLFAVGGGLATIPFLYDLSDKYQWFTHNDILNFIAVAEATPGPVGVNMATFAGYTTHGIGGAILSTLSLVLPSFIIILIVAAVLEKFRSNRFVVNGFHFLRPASTALIGAAGLRVLLTVFFDVEKVTFDMFGHLGQVFTHVNWMAILVFCVMFFLMKTFKGHTLIYILIAAGLGILLKL
ncbi:MAG: chromate transporter [Lachnospiraceae bacterium]|nr:chromate transporter [Lachnospiraceae bacterium]